MTVQCSLRQGRSGHFRVCSILQEWSGRVWISAGARSAPGERRFGGTRRRYHQGDPLGVLLEEHDDCEEPKMRYEKVGRLKPNEVNDTIRVIIDASGDIGIITRERMEMMVSGLEPVMGSSDVGIELLVGEEMIRFLGWQVKGMIESWPRKKAGVWKEFNEKKRNCNFLQYYLNSEL